MSSNSPGSSEKPAYELLQEQCREKNTMEKVTVRIPEEYLEELDESVDGGEYETRSDAIRDALQGLTGVPEPHRSRKHPAA